MESSTVVYTDPPWAIVGGSLEPQAAVIEREVLGPDVDLRFGPFAEGRYTHGEELLKAVPGARALGVYRCQVTEELLDAAGPGLAVVARQGVGTDNLNAPLLARRGIIGFNIPDYCVDEVAAHTLAMILAWERRLIPQHTGLTGGTFSIYAGGTPRRLSRRTAGIIGLGRIGKAVAQRLRLFYQRVIAYDPYLHADHMAGYGVEKAELDDLLATSDVVLLHCPLDDTTRTIIDGTALARMKAGALLVNTARGGLVDAEALYGALSEGDLGGAALDVFVPEDPHTSPWYSRVLSLPNVVVTSHRAFLSEESEASSRRRVAEGIRRVLETGLAPHVGDVTAELRR